MLCWRQLAAAEPTMERTMSFLKTLILLVFFAASVSSLPASAQTAESAPPVAKAAVKEKFVGHKAPDLPDGYQVVGLPKKTMSLSCPGHISHRECQSVKKCDGHGNCRTQIICWCLVD
jgi:hypothetical protein